MDKMLSLLLTAALACMTPFLHVLLWNMMQDAMRPGLLNNKSIGVCFALMQVPAAAITLAAWSLFVATIRDSF